MKGNFIGWLLSKIARIPPRDFEKTIEATIRVLSSRPQRPVDALLLFGRAIRDDSKELFDFVAHMPNNGEARNILLNGSKGERQGGTIPGESWAGGEVFWRRLEERDAEETCKHFSKPAHNTAEEARKFLSYALEQKWKSLVLVAWPHQMLRCMGSMVSAMKERNVYIDVYCACPDNCDWLEEVMGSQGMNMMARYEHIPLEYSRIHQYANKGVASIDEILEYMNQRDRKNR